MGANIEATDDGMIIHGPSKLTSAVLSSHGDHRLALAMSIAAMLAKNESKICFAQVVDDSFPSYVSTLNKLGANLREE
jgi:3-phosphoshikimate 1-carboxyvinyltransferase